MSEKANFRALLPMIVFLVLFIGTGIALTAAGADMPFYQLSATVAIIPAIVLAILQGKDDLNKKIGVFLSGVGEINIITMCMIFLLAGGFASVASAIGGVKATVNFGLSLLPPSMILPGLFLIGAFISTAMGTSMGTVAAIAPIAVGVGEQTDIPLALLLGVVMSGAMFGDNLSMISDTTIAATRTQGCEMKDKFRENFRIAFPAAVATLIFILILSFQTEVQGQVSQSYHLVQVIPYVLVLIGGMIGINVFVVLLIGIVSGAFIMLLGGHIASVELLANMGTGVSGMFETCMVAILVAAMCALIREYGGFEALLGIIRKAFRGRRGGQLGMVLCHAWLDSSDFSRETRRSAWYGTSGRHDGHCDGKQHSGDRYGKSDRKRNGTGVRHYTKKSSLDPGYVFLYFSGHYPVWSTDAGGDFSGQRAWRRTFCFSDHAETVLSDAAACQFRDHNSKEKVKNLL